MKTYIFEAPISIISREYQQRSVHYFCSSPSDKLKEQFISSIRHDPSRCDEYIKLLEEKDDLERELLEKRNALKNFQREAERLTVNKFSRPIFGISFLSENHSHNF